MRFPALFFCVPTMLVSVLAVGLLYIWDCAYLPSVHTYYAPFKSNALVLM